MEYLSRKKVLKNARTSLAKYTKCNISDHAFVGSKSCEGGGFHVKEKNGKIYLQIQELVKIGARGPGGHSGKKVKILCHHEKSIFFGISDNSKNFLVKKIFY